MDGSEKKESKKKGSKHKDVASAAAGVKATVEPKEPQPHKSKDKQDEVCSKQTIFLTYITTLFHSSLLEADRFILFKELN